MTVTVNKDRLPKSLKSSTSSDDPKIGHSNASKERSSKRTGEKRKSTSHLEKGKKIRDTRDLHFSGSNVRPVYRITVVHSEKEFKRSFG